MKNFLLALLAALFIMTNAEAQTVCPDGYWTGNGYCILPPDGVACIAEGKVWLEGECKQKEQGIIEENLDTDLMHVGFMGAVLSWATGFGVGLVIAMVRKLRT